MAALRGRSRHFPLQAVWAVLYVQVVKFCQMAGTTRSKSPPKLHPNCHFSALLCSAVTGRLLKILFCLCWCRCLRRTKRLATCLPPLAPHQSVSSTAGTHSSKTSPASETGHHEQNFMPRNGWKTLSSGWEGFALLCKSTQQGWLNLKAGMCLSGGRCQEISILPRLETQQVVGQNAKGSETMETPSSQTL